MLIVDPPYIHVIFISSPKPQSLTLHYITLTIAKIINIIVINLHLQVFIIPDSFNLK